MPWCAREMISTFDSFKSHFDVSTMSEALRLLAPPLGTRAHLPLCSSSLSLSSPHCQLLEPYESTPVGTRVSPKGLVSILPPPKQISSKVWEKVVKLLAVKGEPLVLGCGYIVCLGFDVDVVNIRKLNTSAVAVLKWCQVGRQPTMMCHCPRTHTTT